MKVLDCFLDDETSNLHLVEVDGRTFLITRRQAEAVTDQDALNQSLKQLQDSLIKSYLSSNLEDPGLPLKSFINGLEQKIVTYALQIAMGNQKNAAHLLGLKPTTLGEKLKRFKDPEA